MQTSPDNVQTDPAVVYVFLPHDIRAKQEQLAQLQYECARQELDAAERSDSRAGNSSWPLS